MQDETESNPAVCRLSVICPYTDKFIADSLIILCHQPSFLLVLCECRKYSCCEAKLQWQSTFHCENGTLCHSDYCCEAEDVCQSDSTFHCENGTLCRTRRLSTWQRRRWVKPCVKCVGLDASRGKLVWWVWCTGCHSTITQRKLTRSARRVTHCWVDFIFLVETQCVSCEEDTPLRIKRWKTFAVI